MITIGQGITLGSGITITSVSSNTYDLRWDTNYIGPDTQLDTPFGNTVIYDTNSGYYSSLGTVPTNVQSNVMWTISLGYVTNPTNGLGAGNHSANLATYLGADTNSWGFDQFGNIYYGNSQSNVGIPTWGTPFDVIDVCQSNSAGNVWIRVNGGAWNGNVSADPSAGLGGIPLPPVSGPTYPGATLGGETGPTEFVLEALSPYGTPASYTQLGPNLAAFAITSSELSNPTSAGLNFANVSANGFSIISGTYPGSLYGADVGNSVNNTITAAFTQAGAGNDIYNGTMWRSTWASGSGATPPYPGGGPEYWYSYVSHVGLQNQGGNNQFLVLPMETNDPSWYATGGTGIPLPGNYNFPAIFTTVEPVIVKGGWC